MRDLLASFVDHRVQPLHLGPQVRNVPLDVLRCNAVRITPDIEKRSALELFDLGQRLVTLADQLAIANTHGFTYPVVVVRLGVLLRRLSQLGSDGVAPRCRTIVFDAGGIFT